jgi:hypothetical protein
MKPRMTVSTHHLLPKIDKIKEPAETKPAVARLEDLEEIYPSFRVKELDTNCPAHPAGHFLTNRDKKAPPKRGLVFQQSPQEGASPHYAPLAGMKTKSADGFTTELRNRRTAA